jgi:hypothetical protein
MTDLVAVPHGRAPIGHCRLVLAGTGCDCENGQRPTKFHEALWAHSRACTIATSRFAAKPTHDATEPRAIWAQWACAAGALYRSSRRVVTTCDRSRLTRLH